MYLNLAMKVFALVEKMKYCPGSTPNCHTMCALVSQMVISEEDVELVGEGICKVCDYQSKIKRPSAKIVKNNIFALERTAILVAYTCLHFNKPVEDTVLLINLSQAHFKTYKYNGWEEYLYNMSDSLATSYGHFEAYMGEEVVIRELKKYDDVIDLTKD